MEITKKYKNLQLDLIHRDRENMEFSCVKFDILIFSRIEDLYNQQCETNQFVCSELVISPQLCKAVT